MQSKARAAAAGDGVAWVCWTETRHATGLLLASDYWCAQAAVQKSENLLALLRTQTMWGLALSEGCAVYTQYLFLTWLPSYLQTTKNLSILKTGLFTAVPYAGAMLLGILLGRLSDRLLAREGVKGGRRRSMVVSPEVNCSTRRIGYSPIAAHRAS